MAPRRGFDELAGRVGANKSVLLRTFRQRFGVTPHAYQVAVRVERARAMIARRMPLALVRPHSTQVLSMST
jgi:methylphosphotriester-DNA--protein-cysteine methyltransferase